MDAAIPLPMPRGCVALAPLIPLVLLSGVALTERALRDRGTSSLIGPGVGVALWLVCVHVTARWLQSFLLPFIGWTLVLAVAGGWFAWKVVRRRERWWQPWPKSMLFAAIGATALLVPASMLFFFDQTWISGHMATVAQIQNGWYPPRYSSYPDQEFRYHYGFDTLAAMLSYVLRVDSATAIDVATLALFLYLVVLLGGVARRIVGGTSGATVAVIAAFAGGVPFFCGAGEGLLSAELSGNACKVGSLLVNPALPAYFFQHPFVLGFPLGLCLFVATLREDLPWNAARLAVLGTLLAALSFSQIVVFATFGATAIFVASVQCFKRAPRAIAGIIATAGASLGVAWASGGFFLPPAEAQSLSLGSGVSDSLRGHLEWLLRSFGIHLVLGFIGFVMLKRGRLFLSLLAIGSLAVPLAVHYSQSWDIVKFATIALLSLGIGSGVVVTKLWQLARRLPRREAVAFSTLAVALAGAATSAGLAFHAIFWLGLPSAYHETLPFPLTGDDVRVLAWLRRRVAPGEMVYRARASSRAFNQWGGIATPWPGFPSIEFGLSGRDAARRQLLMEKPVDSDAWLAQDFRWFVLPRRRHTLRARVEKWKAEGRARTRATIGRLEIVRLE